LLFSRRWLNFSAMRGGLVIFFLVAAAAPAGRASTATSAIWKTICREWRMTLAPILISFSRRVVNVQCHSPRSSTACRIAESTASRSVSLVSSYPASRL